MRKIHVPLVPLLVTVAITAQLSCRRQTAAPPPPQPSPSPTEQAQIDAILQRYEDAVGGRDAIAGITSYRLKGTFELARMTGKIESWRKEPDKYVSVMEFPRIGTLKKGFDGQTHWVQTRAGTFTDSEPQEIAKMERDAEAYTVSKIRSLFDSMKLEHKARLSGRDVYMIEGKPAKGPAEKLFFDVENGLLLRWDMARKEGGRTIFVKVHFNEYRDVGAVKVPFKLRFAFDFFNFVVNIDEVEHNIPLDDTFFNKPLK